MEHSENHKAASVKLNMIFHRVKAVTPLHDFILLVEFHDGSVKKYDVKPLMQKIPVFRMLEYVTGLFEQVHVDPGGYGVVWNDEIDIDCNELYLNGEE